MKNLYVIIKKNKDGIGKHAELVADLDYTRKVLSFDKSLCAEIADIKISELMSKEVDFKIPIKIKE